MSGSESLSTNSLVIFIIYVLCYDGDQRVPPHLTFPEDELEFAPPKGELIFTRKANRSY